MLYVYVCTRAHACKPQSMRTCTCVRAWTGEGGAGPSYEEMADAASETGASMLTGMSLYTDTSQAGGPGGSSVGGASGAATSTRAPSTLGGRKAQRASAHKANAKARQGRVKQGEARGRAGTGRERVQRVSGSWPHAGRAWPQDLSDRRIHQVRGTESGRVHTGKCLHFYAWTPAFVCVRMARPPVSTSL